MEIRLKPLEIHESVIKLLKEPELAFLSDVRREDLVSSITMAMIEVAIAANPDLTVNVEETKIAVIKLYYESFSPSSLVNNTSH